MSVRANWKGYLKVAELACPVALYAAARLLGDAGFPVEWHVRPGLAHGIDQEGLDLGAGFIKRVLG